MFPLTITRRAALVGFIGAALQPAIIPRSARAQPGARFGRIEVDVSPLRASAGDPTAAWVAQDLPGDLAQALGGRFAPGDRSGATLVARIAFIYLGPSSGGTGPGGASQDTIKGVLEVRGPNGAIDAQIPLRAISFYYPMSVDQALVKEAYRGRVSALAQAFAGWAPRELGL
jgi:hypothetical protein